MGSATTWVEAHARVRRLSTQPGTGNLDEDPLFADSSGGDYHIRNGSPCVDAGSNNAPELPDTDIDGDPRVIDGDGDRVSVVDMGADEVNQITPSWGTSSTVGPKRNAECSEKVNALGILVLPLTGFLLLRGIKRTR